MPIGVDGQYYLSFSLDGVVDDFILESDLVSFQCLEEAGNYLPTFRLVFYLRNSKISSYLTERNLIKLSMGFDLNNTFDSKLMIVRRDRVRIDGYTFKISLDLVYYCPDFSSNYFVGVSNVMSGVARIRDIVSQFFELDSDLDDSNDFQSWVQHNQTNQQHVQDVWLRSYVLGSAVAVGITMSGVYVIADVISRLKGSDVKFTLTNVDDGSGVVYQGGISESMASAWNNRLGGYGMDMALYDIDFAMDSSLGVKLDSVVTLGNLPRNEGIKSKRTLPVWINDNVHSHYQDAYFINLNTLRSISTVQIELTVPNYYFDVRVLDVVSVLNYVGGSSLDDVLSGRYLVAKVERLLLGKTFSTRLTLCRESDGFGH